MDLKLWYSSNFAFSLEMMENFKDTTFCRKGVVTIICCRMFVFSSIILKKIFAMFLITRTDVCMSENITSQLHKLDCRRHSVFGHWKVMLLICLMHSESFLGNTVFLNTNIKLMTGKRCVTFINFCRFLVIRIPYKKKMMAVHLWLQWLFSFHTKTYTSAA